MPTLPPIYFEKLLEDSPDIVIAVDVGGEVVLYNEGARTALGYSSSEVLGQHVSRVYATIDDARAVMHAMRDADVDAPGKVRNFQTWLRARDGRPVPVAISGCLIHDSNGAEIGSIGFAKDLAEIHRQDQLATLEEIAISVAHELNNPLSAILNNLQLLSRDVLRSSPENDCAIELERIGSVEGSVRKIQSIVNRLTEMAGTRVYGTREYLPGTRMADLSEQPARPASSTAGATARVAGTGLAGLRVLVVDDDLAVLHSVRDLLLAEAASVATATCGLDACTLLEGTPFDIVVSDVVMPDLDGYELFHHVREKFPTLPVILMTAFFYDRDHVLKRSKLEGLDGILFKKPLDPSRLIELVAARCGR